jgi:dipeptidyl aminopeptidase/acylaminoacyl peptidase
MWYATSHLAVVSAQGGEPRVLTKDLDRNSSSPRWSDDGQWIWFGLEDSAEDHIVRIRPDGSELERPVAGGVSAGRFDWAGGTFAFSMSTLDRPTEVHVLDEGQVRQVTHANDEWLSEIDLAETSNVHFPSADGTEIEGFVAFPPDYTTGERYPIILRLHGGPVSQYTHAFNFEAQMFAADGYVVVYTNPRGSSGYGQAFSQAIFADWGNLDFQDVMAGVDYVIEQGWGDPERMGVGGWSYGGILTNYVITQTERFEGAISGASEVLYIANYGHDHYQLVWEQELGLPWEGNNRETWERISPFNRVQHITTPTLLMGGEQDWNVPILNSEQLYQALRRRGIPTQLVVYPDQGHGIRVPSYQKDRYERYLAWYDRWVKQAETPIS